jgi:hypothetical protein
MIPAFLILSNVGNGSRQGRTCISPHATIHFDEVLYDRYSKPMALASRPLIRFALL